MDANKITETIQINFDTNELLDKIIDTYKIKNRSKVFRILLDYLDDNKNNRDIIFKKKRCKRC